MSSYNICCYVITTFIINIQYTFYVTSDDIDGNAAVKCVFVDACLVGIVLQVMLMKH